ncbi:hypothetical protein Hanom_Chr02g00108531 [Helianthus anomalus]
MYTTFSCSVPKSSSSNEAIPNPFLHATTFLSMVKASFTLKSRARRNFSNTTSLRSSASNGIPQIDTSSGVTAGVSSTGAGLSASASSVLAAGSDEPVTATIVSSIASIFFAPSSSTQVSVFSITSVTSFTGSGTGSDTSAGAAGGVTVFSSSLHSTAGSTGLASSTTVAGGVDSSFPVASSHALVSSTTAGAFSSSAGFSSFTGFGTAVNSCLLSASCTNCFNSSNAFFCGSGNSPATLDSSLNDVDSVIFSFSSSTGFTFSSASASGVTSFSQTSTGTVVSTASFFSDSGTTATSAAAAGASGASAGAGAVVFNVSSAMNYKNCLIEKGRV